MTSLVPWASSITSNIAILSKKTSFPFSPNRINAVARVKPPRWTAQLETHTNNIPKMMPHKSYVQVLDTTLRDGEQSGGVALKLSEKLEIASQLANLRVDIIDAGFPSSSKEECEAVKQICMKVGSNVDDNGYVPVIAALTRSIEKDVEMTWEALKYAKYPRVMLLVPCSKIHLQYKLNKTEEEMMKMMINVFDYARSIGFQDIEIALEDAGRADKRYLYQLVGEGVKRGASTVLLADTVGYIFPHEWGQVFQEMKESIPGIENVVLGTHCHDDLGLATANTLAAVYNGARQVEVTINGIGERAGNASLEEVVMALKCRGEDLGGLHTGINTKHIFSTSQMVERLSGLSIQPNKSIVGANAFVHASGIHQDGILKHKGTYQIMTPEDIGKLQSNDGIVLGKLSGRRALRSRLQELGCNLDAETFDNMFSRVRALAEENKKVTDNDLKSLLLEQKIAAT